MPRAAAQCLVQRPAVQQQIQRPIRGANLHGAQRLIPELRHLAERRIEVGGAIAVQQRARIAIVRCLADEQHHFLALTRLKHHTLLHYTARIQSGTDALR